MQDKSVTAQELTVVGSFPTEEMANAAVHQLREAGYDRRQIGFIGPQGEGRTVLVEEHRTSAGPGAAGGLVTGAAAGGALAWIGLVAIPVIGPFVAGGAIGTTLIGAGTGAAAGSLLGALLGLGIPRHRAAYHEEKLRTGRCLVSVQTSEPGVAEGLLRAAGATDVDRGEQTPSDASGDPRQLGFGVDRGAFQAEAPAAEPVQAVERAPAPEQTSAAGDEPVEEKVAEIGARS